MAGLPFAPVRKPFASGAQVTNAVPSRSHAASTGSASRSARLSRFWTAATGTTAARARELSGVDVRDGREADLSLGTQLGKRSERVLERDGRVDDVEVEEVDPLEPEPAQARLARRPQALRPPVGGPAPRALPRETGFRRDHEPLRIRVQRLGDQRLAHLGPVGVCRVDQVHAQLDGPPEQPPRLVRLRRRAPDARACERHGAEPEAAHLQLAADENRVGHREILAGAGC